MYTYGCNVLHAKSSFFVYNLSYTNYLCTKNIYEKLIIANKDLIYKKQKYYKFYYGFKQINNL